MVKTTCGFGTSLHLPYGEAVLRLIAALSGQV